MCMTTKRSIRILNKFIYFAPLNLKAKVDSLNMGDEYFVTILKYFC